MSNLDTTDTTGRPGDDATEPAPTRTPAALPPVARSSLAGPTRHSRADDVAATWPEPPLDAA